MVGSILIQHVQMIDIFMLDQRLEKRGFTSAQSQFQQKLLAAQNTYRAAHCAPALTLDDSLSQSAQKFAETLASKNQLAHSGTPGVGENLYMVGGNSVDGEKQFH